MKLRFEQFNDSELYILRRALIEASKYIYVYMKEKSRYTKEELDLFDSLLVEATNNLKERDSHPKHLF